MELHWTIGLFQKKKIVNPVEDINKQSQGRVKSSWDSRKNIYTFEEKM